MRDERGRGAVHTDWLIQEK